jgi:thioredoxin 1
MIRADACIKIQRLKRKDETYMATITITRENFESEVLRAKQPVLVDFWAEWCGPCRKIAPLVEEIAAKYAGRVKVGKVNADEQPEIALSYKVMGIPTLILFKNGVAVNRLIGLQPKEKIIEMLKQE